MGTFGKNFDFLGRADVRLPVLETLANQWEGITDAKAYPVFTAVGAPGSGKTRLSLELMSFVSKFVLTDPTWEKLPADHFPKITNVADFKNAFRSSLRIYTTFGNSTMVQPSEYTRDGQTCEKAVAARILFSHFNPSYFDGKYVCALFFPTSWISLTNVSRNPNSTSKRQSGCVWKTRFFLLMVAHLLKPWSFFWDWMSFKNGLRMTAT